MTQQPGTSDQSGERDDLGTLSVEDDEAGTQDPADLAGTANSEDSHVPGPSVSEADEA